MKKLARLAGVGGLLLLLSALVPASVLGQALPTPKDFVSNLDVRCYQIPNQPAVNVPLRLDHLNPFFVQQGVPFENVVLQQPRELCVPVRKNALMPPDNVLQFLRYVDWKCYGINGPPLNLTVPLTQLNPVIAGMFGPNLTVTLFEPQQLCVPVRKNNQNIPPAVLQLISNLDVKCYRAQSNQNPAGAIQLTHLNPLFAGAAPQVVNFLPPPNPSQLCVPVMKNLQAPPAAVAEIIRYSDVLCYRVQGPPLNQNLLLTHLNPVLVGMGLPPEAVFISNTTRLCVPVAKGTFFPPG